MPALLLLLAFFATPVLAGKLYAAFREHCRLSCDACRLNSAGSAAVPHSCPLARWRYAVWRRKDGVVVEFGREISQVDWREVTKVVTVVKRRSEKERKGVTA